MKEVRNGKKVKFIERMEKALEEASQILAIREEAVTETQKVFDKVSKVLADAKKERTQAVKTVN